jgi:hypothetical protein
VTFRLLCALAVSAALLLPASSRADDDGPRAGLVAVGAVGADGATVSATLWLDDGRATYWFEYGTTPALGSFTPAAMAPARDGAVTVSQTLGGLTPGTAYHVRLVATGDGERDEGRLTTFTTAAPAPADPPASPPPPLQEGAPQPTLGATVVAAAERGTIRVRLPGSDRAVALAEAAGVPVGTIVDARRGAVALTAALPDGGVQHGSFGGGRFKVRQRAAAGGRTDLHLRGGSFARCRRTSPAARTLATIAGKRPKPIRRLWGRDRGGRFRTHGRDSVATVRGTRWSVADRCGGTLTRVSEGAVDVRDRRTGRTVRVRAGEHHFARHRR